jgi:hypothetical protein
MWLRENSQRYRKRRPRLLRGKMVGDSNARERRERISEMKK